MLGPRNIFLQSNSYNRESTGEFFSVPLPKQWMRHVKSAVLRVISLATLLDQSNSSATKVLNYGTWATNNDVIGKELSQDSERSVNTAVLLSSSGLNSFWQFHYSYSQRAIMLELRADHSLCQQIFANGYRTIAVKSGSRRFSIFRSTKFTDLHANFDFESALSDAGPVHRTVAYGQEKPLNVIWGRPSSQIA